MLLFPFLLVLVSVFSHAGWNFLAKRAFNKDIFLGISKIAEVLMFAPPFAWLAASEGYDLSAWYFMVGAAVLVFLYYLFLAQAYQRIDLSVAYPIARSSSLFLPFLAYVFIGETINTTGALSVLLVTSGVLLIQMDSFSRDAFGRLYSQFARPGIIFALLTALAVASYTLWDKVAISHMHPFLYLYSYTTLIALFYLLPLSRFSKESITAEWRSHKYSILLVGFLDIFTYALVLVALGMSKATYVGALRQLSLVVGVFLGWRFLREPVSIPRVVAVALLLLGGGLILLAR